MWTLYRPDGFIMRFYVEGCARLYAGLWGGKLVYDANGPEDTELFRPDTKIAA